MSAIDELRHVFHAIAGVLVWPVLIGLCALMAGMLLALGGLAHQFWERWRGLRREFEADRTRVEAAAAGAGGDRDVRIEEALQTAERRRWRAVSRLRLAVRVGPSLGLMGTLIPMADALQGLADGNLPQLASNMVTAFAATVVGLTISVVAYLASATLEQWARDDGAALALHAEYVSRQQPAA